MRGYIQAILGRLLQVDFVRFCIVGTSGFAINLLILTGAERLAGLPIYAAQFLGSEVALFSNFLLHHNWTYKRNNVRKSIASLLLQFHATTWPAIIGSTIMVTAGVNVLKLNSTVALIAASVIALMWNFLWSKFYIWRKAAPKEESEEKAS